MGGYKLFERNESFEGRIKKWSVLTTLNLGRKDRSGADAGSSGAITPSINLWRCSRSKDERWLAKVLRWLPSYLVPTDAKNGVFLDAVGKVVRRTKRPEFSTRGLPPPHATYLNINSQRLDKLPRVPRATYSLRLKPPTRHSDWEFDAEDSPFDSRISQPSNLVSVIRLTARKNGAEFP